MTPSNALTDRQREVLGIIVSFTRRNGFPPTLRELLPLLKIRSTNAVSDHLTALERKGAIVWSRAKARGIRVVGDAIDANPVATLDEARNILASLDRSAVLPGVDDPVALVRRLARGIVAQAERRTTLSVPDEEAIEHRYGVLHDVLTSLAEAFGVSPRTVHAVLVRRGVAVRPRGRPKVIVESAREAA